MRFVEISILSVCLVLFMVSCDVVNSDSGDDENGENGEEEVTEETPEYSTEEDVEEEITDIYADITHEDYYGFNFLVMSSLSSDVIELAANTDNEETSDLQEFDRYQVDPENSVVESFWNKAYDVIQRGDTLVRYLPESDLNEEFIEQSIGEVRFLQALAYFDLVRTFGGVPINELGEEDRARATREESLEHTISFLHEAIDTLPEFSESSTVSRQTAMALLSRCYLYIEEWPDAADISTELIESGMFSLSEDYPPIFDNPGNEEIMFSLEIDSDKLSNWFLPEEQGGNGRLLIHQEFGDAFTNQSEDIRNQLVYTDDSGPYSSLKYNSDGTLALPLLRFSETQLNLAEALVQMGEASQGAEYLNEVRTRNNLEPVTSSDQTVVLEAVWQERGKEFLGEGHRWFDLVRTERAVDVLQDIPLYSGSTTSLDEEYKQKFPIPLTALEENPNMAQNPGY